MKLLRVIVFEEKMRSESPLSLKHQRLPVSFGDAFTPALWCYNIAPAAAENNKIMLTSLESTLKTAVSTTAIKSK